MRKIILIVLIVYVLLTVYTIASSLIGIRYQPFFTPLLTLLAFTFALLHGSQRLGWRGTLTLLAATFGVSLAFESLGVATGLVYGPYHYTNKLGPKFLGLVPYLIPFAWFMMTYPSYVIADRIVPAGWSPWKRRISLAGIGAIVMTAWDLAMDPMMVAGGHWIWDTQGAYFGVPLQNYWGWWLTTFVTFLVFQSVVKAPSPRPEQDPQSLDRLAILSFLSTGLGTVAVDLTAGLGGPALVGLFAMLPWFFIAWLDS